MCGGKPPSRWWHRFTNVLQHPPSRLDRFWIAIAPGVVGSVLFVLLVIPAVLLAWGAVKLEPPLWVGIGLAVAALVYLLWCGGTGRFVAEDVRSALDWKLGIVAAEDDVGSARSLAWEISRIMSAENLEAFREKTQYYAETRTEDAETRTEVGDG